MRYGQKAGAGFYQCTLCKKKIKLKTDEERLPVCRNCGRDPKAKYRKLA